MATTSTRTQIQTHVLAATSWPELYEALTDRGMRYARSADSARILGVETPPEHDPDD